MTVSELLLPAVLLAFFTGCAPAAIPEDPEEPCSENLAEGMYQIQNSDDLAELREVTTLNGTIILNASRIFAYEFPCLEEVSGALELGNFEATETVDAPRLRKIVGGLTALSDDHLEALDGLPRLEFLGSVSLQCNARLTSIEGLGSPTVASSITITGNRWLGDEQAQAWVDQLPAVGGPVDISGNSPEGAASCMQ